MLHRVGRDCPRVFVRELVLGVVSAWALAGVGCASAPLVISPVALAPACPVEGCSAKGEAVAPRPAASDGLCSEEGDAPCAGAGAEECTERALAAWSEAQDERALACVARTLADACSLDDPRACAFAGRLWLDGHGVTRDVHRGLDMLLKACDVEIVMACVVAARALGEGGLDQEVDDAQELTARIEAERTCWGGQSDACFQVGVRFYYGRDTFPRDRGKASRAFARGCDLGDARACNNVGDGLAYGDGVPRNVEGAAQAFLKACSLGEPLGCANLGYMNEHGEGVPRDVLRARKLYRQACSAGDIYGCLHVDLLSAEDAGAPRDPTSALAHFRRACEKGKSARACAFVGLMYEDGPDGVARDEAKSLEAMTRACQLGETRACDWVRSHED